MKTMDFILIATVGAFAGYYYAKNKSVTQNNLPPGSNTMPTAVTPVGYVQPRSEWSGSMPGIAGPGCQCTREHPQYTYPPRRPFAA